MLTRSSAASFLLLVSSLAAAGCGRSDVPADPSPAAGSPSSTAHEPSGLPLASPGDVAMSAEALARIEPAMRAYVEDGRVAGVMTLVARRGRIVHHEAVGMRDLEAEDPLEPDDIFRIYSMTKPVTSVAVMMLVERGLIGLDDPVADYLPEFADVSVLTGDGERVPPDRAMTVRHLLTHTSGLTYGVFGDSSVDRLYLESNLFSEASDLDDFTRRVAELPLIASPGDRWNYSVSTDVLGHLVEVVSGQPFDAFVGERILAPLSLDDTAFHVDANDLERFTVRYEPGAAGLEVSDPAVGGLFSRPPAWLSGGGGLTSTASDYVRFAQMLLQEGALDGVRLLEPETVRTMRANHLPAGQVPIDVGDYVGPGYGFGLGFAVLVDAEATPEPDRDGVFRWAGVANTYFWIDPVEELIGMVWTQVDPFAGLPIEREFQTLVYEALE